MTQTLAAKRCAQGGGQAKLQLHVAPIITQDYYTSQLNTYHASGVNC